MSSQNKKIPFPDTPPVWHTLSADDALVFLKTTPSGLIPSEVHQRLRQYGPNQLCEARSQTAVQLFLSQFKDFMILLLLAAAVISALTADLKDAAAIAAILILNAVIGFTQEYRAQKAMEALKAMSAPHASVIRGGHPQVIHAHELVPGDWVLLEAGQIVPADIRLVRGAQLKADESALTGESVPSEKRPDAAVEEKAGLGDRFNMVYKGTIITYGRGAGVAVATGMNTEFGKIAALLDQAGEVKTPLQKRLAEFGKKLSMAAMVICGAVFMTGMLRGEDLLLMFMTAVSLAVAAIPEALPAVVTIGLALGAKKMVQKNALVRKLPAVETLGSVTYICTDKTGTLTLNRMRAEIFFADGKQAGPAETGALFQGEPWISMAKAMALCNDASLDAKGAALGDPTETALYEAAKLGGFSKEIVEKDSPRVLEIPFDSDRKCMTTFHREAGGSFTAYIKGAAEVILKKSVNQRTAAGLVPMNSSALLEIAERMASEGLRVLAFAKRTWHQLPDLSRVQDAEEELTFLGFAGLLDPPREEARESVRMCREAGIVPVMITGDHPQTARAIAKRIGILDAGDQGVMSGSELERLTPEMLKERVEKVRVYARVSPDQKLKIVTALQECGQFAAMTGDGVNDAPALKRADIGIAMGITGTDVAKEASAMILLDDHFATIVRAVKEGRRIYDNMRRFIRYAVTTNSAEVWIIFTAPFLGLPIPFLPIQILWINLLTDGLPGLALAAEPAEKNIMQRPPRPPKESVFAHGLGLHAVWVGILMAVLVLGSQAFMIQQGQEHWRSFIFTLLCFSQLAHVLAIRSESQSLFSQGLLSNKPLLCAVILTFTLQMMTLYVPAMRELFKTQPLSVPELFCAAGLSLAVFFAVELEKKIRRSGLKELVTMSSSV